MKVSKIKDGYVIEDGPWTHYCDTLDDVKTYVGLVGYISMEIDKKYKLKGRKRLCTEKRFAQPMNYLEGK